VIRDEQVRSRHGKIAHVLQRRSEREAHERNKRNATSDATTRPAAVPGWAAVALRDQVARDVDVLQKVLRQPRVASLQRLRCAGHE
jgi:hypothetical protein